MTPEVTYEDEDQRINGHDYEADDPREGEDCFESAMWNAYPPTTTQEWS